MTERRVITIAGHGGRIDLTVKGYQSGPGIGINHYDDNTLECTLEAVIGAFRGIVIGDVYSWELLKFREQLGQMTPGSPGSASLTPMGLQLSCSVATVSPTGQLTVTGEITMYTDPSAKLSFEFCSDPSYLAHTIRQLDVVLDDFPGRLA